MTRPEPTGETEGKIEAGVQEKDDFDEASDFCDFGYVLASSAGPGPAPTTQRRRDGFSLIWTHAEISPVPIPTRRRRWREATNLAPRIYKRGEHISRSYGAFDDVMNWERFRLAKPPEGSHWVHFGDNYLLVKDESGLITEIVKAS